MYVVIRNKDTVIIDIFKNKIDNTYSFINITKRHICPCKFNSVEEALQDLEKYKKQNKIKKYYKIEKENNKLWN
ncbi:hypothetical protein [Clostridium perfringens]|uniref:hypothetical protein n=1 Tax=Clostridium perfringens TaxID=1502 RepID=UPI0023413B57|nr:hypothetical protein [Clostridium perfringens]MDC4245707.1 hypothetical protein [Clostridium perfringens]